MPTVVTRDLIDKILEKHNEGMTGSSIARELGIGKTTVNKYIKIYSADKKDVNTDKYTKDLVDRMTQEYNEGKSIASIAREYSVSASSLATYIYRNIQEVTDSEATNKEATNKEATDSKAIDNQVTETGVKELNTIPYTDDYNKRKHLADAYLQNETNLALMVSLYKNGTSLSKIAKLTGLARSTVTRAIYKEMGIKKHPIITEAAKPNGAIIVGVKPWSLEEKIQYCNEKYGEGRWRFLTKQEIMDYLREDGVLTN